MKMRRNSGLRTAHSTYQGDATAKKEAIPSGCSRRRLARQARDVKAQRAIAPAARITAAGPFAKVAAPRNAPKAIRALLVAFVFSSIAAAVTAAAANRAAKSMSGVAARANAMAAIVLGIISKQSCAAEAP